MSAFNLSPCRNSRGTWHKTAKRDTRTVSADSKELCVLLDLQKFERFSSQSLHCRVFIKLATSTLIAGGALANLALALFQTLRTSCSSSPSVAAYAQYSIQWLYPARGQATKKAMPTVDQNISLTAACLLCFGFVFDAAADQKSLWTYNDSVMYLVVRGQEREFRYQEPRPALKPFGVTPDTLAFRGVSRNGEYVGTAFTFSRECGPLSFPVRGPILDNGQRVLLAGRLPQVDAQCQNIGFRDHELEFRLVKGIVDEVSPNPERPQPPAPPSPPTWITGSGVVIGAHGEVLTNAHVVENCTNITVGSSSASAAYLVARDEKNDLAVVRSNLPASSVVVIREGPVRAGDTVVALGYPLSGLLATKANLSVGNVSALAGLGDDLRYLQISAPVQPGNSGGPLLDASGHLIGIVTGKLDMRLAPQNVNFALEVEVARTFLDSQNIAYQTARSQQQLSPADVGDIGRPFTVRVECESSPSTSR